MPNFTQDQILTKLRNQGTERKATLAKATGLTGDFLEMLADEDVPMDLDSLQALNDWFSGYYGMTENGYVLRRPQANHEPVMVTGFGIAASEAVLPPPPPPVVARGAVPPPDPRKKTADMTDEEYAALVHWDGASERAATHKAMLEKSKADALAKQKLQQIQAAAKLQDRLKAAAADKALNRVAEAERAAAEALDLAARKQAILARLKEQGA